MDWYGLATSGKPMDEEAHLTPAQTQRPLARWRVAGGSLLAEPCSELIRLAQKNFPGLLLQLLDLFQLLLQELHTLQKGLQCIPGPLVDCRALSRIALRYRALHDGYSG